MQLRERSDATTANPFTTPATARHSGLLRFAQRAPGREEPDTRDRAGAQRGMILLLAGGGLFWAAVAAICLMN